jgi:hypothetical protein
MDTLTGTLKMLHRLIKMCLRSISKRDFHPRIGEGTRDS